MPRISRAGARTCGDSDVIGASAAFTTTDMTSGSACEAVPLELLGPDQLPIGGAGVLPQSGAGGQVLTDPCLMPASALSIVDSRTGMPVAVLVNAETLIPLFATL